MILPLRRTLVLFECESSIHVFIRKLKELKNKTMASYYNENTILYLNGEYVKATEAKMDFYSQSLHYGYAVFEGIRSYKTVDGQTRIFRATEHYNRLRNSADAMNMPYKWTTEELIEITYEVLKRNNLQDAYIRPVVYAPANMSFTKNTESFIVIEVWEMSPFFGEKLLRIMTSSFQRPNPKGFKIEAKASGHYVNSILASQEAKSKGYDEALLTDMNSFVAEGTGANMFYEKDRKLFTTEEEKGADGAFFCGTAGEVIGWESLDDIMFTKKWDETLSKKIQLTYKDRVTEKTNIKQEKMETALA